MEALLHMITQLGIYAVIAVIYAESGLLIGFFLPGDSLLFTAGFLTHQGIFAINIHVFILLLWIAAVLGDSTGYAFGHKVGRKLFEKENSRLFKKKYLVEAEAFFERHGPIAIFLARFVPVVRTFTPIIAGISKMNYKTFLAYNVVGGLVWTAAFTYLGFYLGKILTDAGINIELIAIAIVIISIAPMIIHAVKEPARRKALWQGTINEINTLLNRKKR